MKRLIITAVFLLIAISLVFLYLNNKKERRIIYINKAEDILLDPQVVEAWDVKGDSIFKTKKANKDSILLVKNSLNGEVFYRFKKNNNGKYEKVEVFKIKDRQELVSFSFNNDTLTSGHPFKGFVFINDLSNKKIFFVKAEDKYEVTKEEGEYGVKYTYKDKIPQKGINIFEGVLINKGDSISINYKYYVL